MSTRLYIAQIGDKRRIVEAFNPAQARAHVARDAIEVKLAPVKEAAVLLSSGVEIEQAGNADPQSDDASKG